MQHFKTLSNTIRTVFRKLETSHYLKAEFNGIDNITDMELLTNGERFCEQLLLQWRKQTHQTDPNIPRTFLLEDIDGMSIRSPSRTAFITSPQFLKHINHFRNDLKVKYPLAIKIDSHIPSVELNKSLVRSICSLQFAPNYVGSTFLVTDLFLSPSVSLKKFHSYQRERKIWWMRFSSNPSRYICDPHPIPSGEDFCEISQSVTIKAQFPFGSANMEHITLVQLQNSCFKDDYSYSIQQKNENGTLMIPDVIRSVIDLESATCALLLDATDHALPDTLLLNRKLAPFQCTVMCLRDGIPNEDLITLMKHIYNEIRRAGLRYYDQNKVIARNRDDLNKSYLLADSIGIPYTLLIDDDSLDTGLMKMRNRNTTLEETIHISDIPDYLLNIFNSQL